MSTKSIAYTLTHPSQIEILKEFNLKYNIDIIAIEKNNIDQNENENNVCEIDRNIPLLKVTKNQLVLEHQGEMLFFHPNMSLLRMINIIRGEGDRLLQAANIVKGDIFLDATAGLAADALIASWAVGDTGKVLALEASPLIHFIVEDGLKRLKKKKISKTANQIKYEAWNRLIKTSPRIEMIYNDHTNYLASLPDASIDIIYFDPMFRQTVETSPALKSLKIWSYPEALSLETIKEACRVARKRIVLKEKKNSGEFERLGFKMKASSKYNPICFGTIELL